VGGATENPAGLPRSFEQARRAASRCREAQAGAILWAEEQTGEDVWATCLPFENSGGYPASLPLCELLQELDLLFLRLEAQPCPPPGCRRRPELLVALLRFAQSDPLYQGQKGAHSRRHSARC
jgi:hypothetical protein